MATYGLFRQFNAERGSYLYDPSNDELRNDAGHLLAASAELLLNTAKLSHQGVIAIGTI
jgi:hypothetical protein